jgi:YidC/Oxa1 family membrane protein insertase
MLPGIDQGGGTGGLDTKRLVITVLLVTVGWMGFQWLFPSTPAPAAATASADAGPAAPSNVASATPATADGTPSAVAPAVGDDSAPEEHRTISADVAAASQADKISVRGGYRAELTSKGAQLSGFQLDGYKDAKNVNEIDLANADEAGARMLALRSRGNSDVQLAADASYRVVSSDEHKVVFERATASGVVITRTFTFDPARFAFTDEVALKNTAASKKTALLDLVMTAQERTGERDEGGFLSFSSTPDALAGACKVDGKRESFTNQKVEKEEKKFPGKVDYVALDRHYFLGAVIFNGDAERCRAQSYSHVAAGAAVKGMQLVVEQSPIEIAPGETKVIKHDAYFGPKQVGLLTAYGHDLGENINFSWFAAICRPILLVLVKLDGFTGNFGLAIILLTLALNAVTFPLTQKSYVSMQKVKKFKPQIDELQKKYGHDRTLLGQKQMELYQKEGVNPLAGCFPMLITMPIWFALYRTLSQAVELYQQPFAFGILDLTQPDHLLFGIPLLPLIVGGLMFFQTWLQPPPSDQPQMKYMMWFMPFMFTFMMLQMASGLSIYMIANSLTRMAQQLYIKRKYK